MTPARCDNCLHGADFHHPITGACYHEGEGGGCPCEAFELEEEAEPCRSA
mgnify:CR=1 FL=1